MQDRIPWNKKMGLRNRKSSPFMLERKSRTALEQVPKNQFSRKNKTAKAVKRKLQSYYDFIRKLFKLLIVLGVVVFLCWEAYIFLFTTSYFELKNIFVENNKFVTKKEIIDISGLRLKTNVFKIKPYEVGLKIKQIRRIKNVKLDYKNFTSIVINVEERLPISLIYYKDIFFNLDNEGVIFKRRANEAMMNLPILKGIENLKDNQGTDYLKKLIKDIFITGKSYLKNIYEINVSSRDNIFVYTIDGLKVYFGRSEQFLSKMELLKSVEPQLKKNKEIIDSITISDNNNITYKKKKK